jgi:hypothetical protein
MPMTRAHHAAVNPLTTDLEAVLLEVDVVSVLIYETAAQM